MPIYASGKSPVELMNRLPYIRLKEMDGDGNVPIKGNFEYDSYFEGTFPQLRSKDMRGTIYVTSFKGSNRGDSSSTYEITFRAETLDWIHSAFLKRDKEWELTYGWTDDYLTYSVRTTSINPKFDSSVGGFDLTLGFAVDGIDKHRGIKSINKTMQKGIQGNKVNLSIDMVMNTYLGEVKRLYGISYTYNKSKSADLAKTFKFSLAEVNKLLEETNSSFMDVLQSVISQYGLKVSFESGRRSVSVVSNEIPPNPNSPKWTFEYKTYDTDILEVDFDLGVQDVAIDKITEKLFVLRPSGEPDPQEQTIEGKTLFNKKSDVEEEVYSAGNKDSYILARENIYLPKLRNGTLKIIGLPDISVSDIIELKGLDDLSGVYHVNIADNEISGGSYTTTLTISGLHDEV